MWAADYSEVGAGDVTMCESAFNVSQTKRFANRTKDCNIYITYCISFIRQNMSRVDLIYEYIVAANNSSVP